MSINPQTGLLSGVTHKCQLEDSSKIRSTISRLPQARLLFCRKIQETGEQSERVQFFRKSNQIMALRKVLVVRHAESVWNTRKKELPEEADPFCDQLCADCSIAEKGIVGNSVLTPVWHSWRNYLATTSLHCSSLPYAADMMMES